MLEYAAVRAVLGVLRRSPRRVAFFAADRLGDLAYFLDRGHREVALTNLARAFGGSPQDARHRRTARLVFRNFVRVAVEFALLPDLLETRGLDDLVHVVGQENVEAALAHGRGVVVFSAHLGNWEVIAACGEPLGLRLHSVGRAMDNPLLDAFLTRQRSRYARSVIPKEGGLPRIVRVLKEGGSVAMLLDQHAGRSGVKVDFLGRPASTFRAAAELAVRMNLPVLGGFGVRIDGRPTFRLEFDPPLFAEPGAPREAEVVRLTQAVSDAIARRVRQHPEQWNWLHRRWRDGKAGAVAAAEESRA